MTAKKKAADRRVPFNVRIPKSIARELTKLAKEHKVSQGGLVEAMFDAWACSEDPWYWTGRAKKDG